MIGSTLVLKIPEEILPWIISLGLFVGLCFILFPFQKLGLKNEQKVLSKWQYALFLFFLLLVGCWSGAFAIAGSTFAALVIVFFLRKTFLESRATESAAAIPETLISAYILFFGVSVSLPSVGIVILFSILGAYIGSHLAILKGNGFVRGFMIVVSLAAMMKVLFDIL